jgi:hypothetical protein
MNPHGGIDLQKECDVVVFGNSRFDRFLVKSLGVSSSMKAFLAYSDVHSEVG